MNNKISNNSQRVRIEASYGDSAGGHAIYGFATLPQPYNWSKNIMRLLAVATTVSTRWRCISDIEISKSVRQVSGNWTWQVIRCRQAWLYWEDRYQKRGVILKLRLILFIFRNPMYCLGVLLQIIDIIISHKPIFIRFLQ